jgi:WD40 repeat protein
LGARCWLVGLTLLAAAAPAAVQPRPAVAFSPDGRTLAVGGYREVALHDTATGARRAVLGGHPASVTSVAFSPDGKSLAAAGGQPGLAGDLRVWDLAAGKARVFPPLHTDVIYQAAWSPDGKRLAACSYDRLVSVWDAAAAVGRPLKDHTDAVYSVAWSPDGSRIASASGDRTVKLWDPNTGKRLFTLSESTAELYSVAFHPSGRQLAAVGVDKMLRKWTLTPTAGTLVRSAFAHDAAILRVLYTPDGDRVYTASEDRSIKLWNGATLLEEKVLDRQRDWPLGLALSPDEKLLAVSRYDGSVALYDAATGALVRRL